MSTFLALLKCIKFVKEPTNALGFMSVILLHNNHRHVSATLVAVFSAMKTRIKTMIKKGKAIPLQAWTGPEGSRRLRLPDFKTIGT
jgi:hypothetical protein